MDPILTSRRTFILAAAAGAMAPAVARAGGTPTDADIVSAAIHPAIGIARVGDSASEYFVGPEVIEPAPAPPGAYRDATGALKRQAARFRIYGLDAAGNVVRELTADDASITWTVHVANRKADWYRFIAALDIPEAASLTSERRNAGVVGAARAGLVIDPGPRSIGGPSAGAVAIDTGAFRGQPVSLGEVRTDAAGRLLFLGGHGRAGSPSGAPIYRPSDPDSFNNADDWYDDTSDGPVSATVALGGRDLPVEGAWVAVAPPNYAPDLIGWRTLHELLVDTYVEAGWMREPDTVSFSTDILPVLRRMTQLQWVNKGFAAFFGKGGALDFSDPALLAKLSRAPARGADPYEALRRVLFNSFRPADPSFNEPRLWPWIYGDAFDSFPDNPPNNSLALSSVRQSLMRRWVEGDFVDDYDPAARPPRTLGEVPVALRPAMLDEAALHFCVADAFHPGCELTWPMRHASLYSKPFRVKRRAPGQTEPDYGPTLSAANALGADGPLNAQGPGDLSRWMAVPWQGDTAFCRSGYDAEYDPYLPTFWPARVPNQVLTADDYAVVMDPSISRAERLVAFHRREHWLRAVSQGSGASVMQRLVERFAELGIVEARPGIAGDPDFPQTMYVESTGAALAVAAAAAAARTAKATDPAVKAGWESKAQRDDFVRTRTRWR